jgi:hypothetical protein
MTVVGELSWGLYELECLRISDLQEPQLNVRTVSVAVLESHGPAINLLSNSPHAHTSRAVISASHVMGIGEKVGELS